MTEKTDEIGRAVKRRDTAEYSGSMAPATRSEAEEREPPSDDRLKPGGAHGSAADVGMSGIDPEGTMSGGQSTGQERRGEPIKK